MRRKEIQKTATKLMLALDSELNDLDEMDDVYDIAVNRVWIHTVKEAMHAVAALADYNAHFETIPGDTPDELDALDYYDPSDSKNQEVNA